MSVLTSDDVSPPEQGPAWPRPVVIVGVVVAVVLGALLIHTLQSGPHFVKRVLVVNPTAYDLNVDVNGPDGALTSLGVARRQATTVFTDVADQGAVWVFNFRAQGQDGGVAQLQRRELQRRGWQVTVPAGLASRLAGEGVQPPP